MLDKLEKQVYRTDGLALAVFLEFLAFRNEANLNIIFLYTALVDVHLNSRIWFPFFALAGGSLFILKSCTIFLVPFLDVMRMYMSSFSFTNRL